jgi:hypothetical protein
VRPVLSPPMTMLESAINPIGRCRAAPGAQ